MTRRLAEDVYWLDNCHAEGPDADTHMHVSEYLIRGEEGDVLVDSGSGHFREEIVAETNRLTDGAGPDVVLLAHSTLPHTENVPAFEEEWGDVETVAATGRFPELVGLPDATPRQFNRPVEFAGRPFTCIHPLLTDVTVSQWIFDHRSRILFTAEAFGHYHSPGECDRTTAELDGGLDFSNVEAFYHDKLPFVDFLDVEKLDAAFDSLFDVLDVQYVAPIHGNPVDAEDVDAYVDDVIRALAAPATA